METKTQYQTGVELTDAERFNRLSENAQVAYLLALRHIDDAREIRVVDHRALADLIVFGDCMTEWTLVEAIREWWQAGLVTVPDESAEGLRRIVFAEHELMGPVCHGSDVDLPAAEQFLVEGGKQAWIEIRYIDDGDDGFVAIGRSAGATLTRGFDFSLGAAIEALECDLLRSWSEEKGASSLVGRETERDFVGLLPKDERSEQRDSSLGSREAERDLADPLRMTERRGLVTGEGGEV